MSKYRVNVDFGVTGFNGTYSLINAMWVVRKYASRAKVTIPKPKKD